MQIDGLSGGLGVLDQENKVGAAAQLSIRGFIDGGHGSAARILGHIGGGAAAVQVQRRDAAQLHHALGQLRQSDTGGIAALGTIHSVEDQSAVCLNAHSGTGRPLVGGVEHKAGHGLSILNQGLVAAQGIDHIRPSTVHGAADLHRVAHLQAAQVVGQGVLVVGFGGHGYHHIPGGNVTGGCIFYNSRDGTGDGLTRRQRGAVGIQHHIIRGQGVLGLGVKVLGVDHQTVALGDSLVIVGDAAAAIGEKHLYLQLGVAHDGGAVGPEAHRQIVAAGAENAFGEDQVHGHAGGHGEKSAVDGGHRRQIPARQILGHIVGVTAAVEGGAEGHHGPHGGIRRICKDVLRLLSAAGCGAGTLAVGQRGRGGKLNGILPQGVPEGSCGLDDAHQQGGGSGQRRRPPQGRGPFMKTRVHGEKTHLLGIHTVKMGNYYYVNTNSA